MADARIQQVFDAPALNVDIDRSLAAEVGLDRTGCDQHSAGIRSPAASRRRPRSGSTRRPASSYPLVVQMPQYRIASIGDLSNIPADRRRTVPSSFLADSPALPAYPTTRWSRTTMFSRSSTSTRPRIDAISALSPRTFKKSCRDMEKEVPRGSTVALRGQISTMTTAYNELFAGLACAVVLIYLLIVVNFQSWLDPFVIVTGLPAALAGIVWMLFITGTTLSVPALTGAIMCMGVATANSILVVSFARERMAEGADAVAAAVESGFTRFRPVLMTALAMIIGMAPMALSAEQNAPLGRAVIGGLIFATIATLFFVPGGLQPGSWQNATTRNPTARPEFPGGSSFPCLTKTDKKRSLPVCTASAGMRSSSP